MALLILQPRPVNTPGGYTDSLGVAGKLVSERDFRGLTNVEEGVRVGAALPVSTAVVGTRCATAPFTSKGRKALAFAS